jgi:hypothetical protein
MTRLRHLGPLAGFIAALAIVAAPRVATAETVCELDPITREQRCYVRADPTPTEIVTLGGGGVGARLPLQWIRFFFATADDVRVFPSGPTICVTRDSTGNLVEVGAWYWVSLINTETGEQLFIDSICVMPGEPPPAPPPPPPTEGEFREAAEALLRLDTLLNPRAEFGGITGVETWLWCVDPGAVPVSVGPLRGWTASASMSPVEFYWRVDGVESWSASASSCGSESDPPATWMPETMGDYSVTGGATWAGTWTLSWNGIPLGTFVLGPFDFDSAPVAYPVDEFVGELEPDPRTR